MQVQWSDIIEGVIIRLSARIAENEYMAFGLSGADGRSQMIGGDVTIAYFDADTNTFHAEDYILRAKSQVYSYSNIFIRLMALLSSHVIETVRR